VEQSTSVTGRPPFVSRDSLLGAACVLFAEHGYQATSMKDIAGALGVRAPSLYNHVAAKQDILHAIMDRAMDRAIGALAEALDGVTDVADRLRAAAESLVLDFLRNPAEVTVCNTEVRSLEPANRAAIVAKRDYYAAQVRQIIDEGCRTGRFQVRSPRLAAFAVLEMGNGAKSWFRPDGSYSDAEVAREYGEFALRIAGYQLAGHAPGQGPGHAPGHQPGAARPACASAVS
jgi:AcrR family transcriptional regulator